jgi:hypothetical protein
MENKIPDSQQLAVDIIRFLATKENVESQAILSALSTVLATLAIEAGLEEEKAVYAFRKSLSSAERRLKRIRNRTKE